ncbi:MAG: Ig-like domain-containing protein [Clostridia bacterium]|nr:Ig-like domain-containing protein [Clostridia bacterium]
MKKLVSLVTILCLALSLCIIPAAAAEPTLTVGTIAEGEVYTEGANIVLTADVSKMSDVKNVDFYANGDKLPGTLIEGNGSLIWYAPAADSYAVKAVATTTAGATVESAAVNIKVESAADIIEVLKMDSANDVKQWKTGAWDSTSVVVKDSNVTDDFAAYGSKALYVKNISYGKNTYIVNNQLAAEIVKDYDLYLVFYSKADVGNYNFMAYDDAGALLTRNTSADNKAIKAGWNVHKLSMANYVGRKLNKITLNTYGYNCSGSGEKGDSYVNAELYISGLYFAKAAPAAPVVTGTSVPNNQTKVCNNLSKYRINFDRAIAKSTAAHAVSVKKSDEALVTEGVTVSAGADYIDVLFAEGALAHNETYTVEVSNALASALGGGFAGASYNFSTTDDACTDAEPIASVVYPEANANVSTSAKLAAKVIFNKNVSKVEFYKGSELLGEAVNYTGNEYVLDNAALSEGANTVKAVVTLNDNSTVTTSEITVNATQATKYAIHGIENGERILINDRNYRTVSVIDEADVNTKWGASAGFLTIPNATGVSKVTFYVDGVEMDSDSTAPYSWDMPFADVGKSHELKVSVLDAIGNVTVYGPYTYTTVYGDVYASSVKDFEDQNVTPVHVSGTSMIAATMQDPDNAENTMLKLSRSASGATLYDFNGTLNTPLTTSVPAASRMLRLTCDLRTNSLYATVNIHLRDTWYSTNYGAIMERTSGDASPVFKAKKTYKITTDIDMDNALYVTYVDGVEYRRGTLDSSISSTDKVTLHVNAVSYSSTAEIYLDNIGVTYYTNRTGALDVEKEDTTVKAINTNDEAEGIKVITATYNGNQLADVVIDDVTVPVNGIFNKTYTVGTNDKLFVWKDFETLKPLTE